MKNNKTNTVLSRINGILLEDASSDLLAKAKKVVNVQEISKNELKEIDVVTSLKKAIDAGRASVLAVDANGSLFVAYIK